MNKIELNKKKQGLLPAIKSYFFGSTESFTTQTTWQILTGDFSFATFKLEHLLKIGYGQNAEVFGALNKIILAQSNIKYIPWRGGKQYKSGTFSFDIKSAMFYLIATGTCIVRIRTIVGFQEKYLEVLKTTKIDETYNAYTKKYKYKYNYGWGYIDIPTEELIFINLLDNPWCENTQLGIGALQAAQFPIENLKELWQYNGGVLKNKGADVIISSKSEMPLLDNEKKEMDDAFLKRSGGTRNAGKAITTTANIDVTNIGRTPKELSLWDGFKVTVRSLAIAMQVDPSILGDVESKTFANRNEAEKALYTSCVIPYASVILNDPRIVREMGFSVFMDTSEIDCLQDDKQKRAETAKTETEIIIELNREVGTGVITKEIAVYTLVSIWKFDEEEAKMLIVDVATNPDVNPNLQTS